MIKEVKDESLYFITQIDEELRMILEIDTALKGVTKPGDFLEKVPDYRSTIEKLDSKITLNKNAISFLLTAYHKQVQQKRAILCNYCTKIEERMRSQNQLNTNVTFYDEEHQLSKSNYQGFEENPSMYSMLSIIKRIANDESHNLDYFEETVSELQNIQTFYKCAQDYILRMKSIFNDQEFVNKFTTEFLTAEAQTSLRDLQIDLSDIRLHLDKSKQKITTLFQMFNAQENDYDIYEKAVQRFMNVALESYFCTGSVTSGIL